MSSSATERLSRSLRLSPAGQTVLAFTVAGLIATTAFGGVLGLLPATALALLLVSLTGAWLHAKGTDLISVGDLVCFAGEEAELALELNNRSRWLAARDVTIWHGPYRPQRNRANALIATLEPRARRTIRVPIKLNERGRHRSCELTLTSTFPLGLAEYRASFRLPTDHLVLPRLGAVRSITERLRQLRGESWQAQRTSEGADEFYGLRDWREGESQRLVHWKISARRGQPIVRELRGEDRPPVHIVLVRQVLGTSRKRHDAFETAVSLAATLCEALVREKFRLRLSFWPGTSESLQIEPRMDRLLPVLRELACVEHVLVDRAAAPAAVRNELASRGEAMVLIWASGSRRTVTAPVSGTWLLDVDSPTLFEVFSPLRREGPGPLLMAAGGLRS
ncbi:MAG: DUF58 domain-containing protein [Planctomycetota bacterium]